MADIASIETAVADSLDRAESVAAERDTSGGDTGYVARISVAGAEPITAAELTSVLTALRASTPEGTAYYGLVFSEGAEEAPVDAEAAAEEIGIRTTGFFTGIMVSSSQVDKAL